MHTSARRLSALWHGDRILGAIMAAALLFGILYNCAILPGLGPDEARHYTYTKQLLEEHKLPLMDRDGNEFSLAHSYHPPLYYALQIPFYALGHLLPGHADYHVMRLFSLALCLACLPLVYGIAMRATNEDRPTALFATAVMALLPNFGMTGSVVNNDSGGLFATVVFLWLLVVKYPVVSGMRSALVLGAVFGLGALCKGTVILADGAALVAYLLVQRRIGKVSLARLGLQFTTIMALVACIAGWWYVRNIVLYGEFQPIPKNLTVAALPTPDHGILVMMMHPNFPSLLGLAIWGIFYSIWMQKDWLPEAMRSPIYTALLLVCLLAIVGGALGWKARRLATGVAALTTQRATALVAPSTAFLFTWFSCLFIAMFVHWGQAEGGRYLLSSFVGFAIPLCIGWRLLLGSKLKAFATAWAVIFIGLNFISLYWLVTYLNPIYGPLYAPK